MDNQSQVNKVNNQQVKYDLEVRLYHDYKVYMWIGIETQLKHHNIRLAIEIEACISTIGMQCR